MKAIYSPELQIIHTEDASTKEALAINKGARYRRFKYKNMAQFFKVLIKQIKFYSKRK